MQISLSCFADLRASNSLWLLVGIISIGHLHLLNLLHISLLRLFDSQTLFGELLPRIVLGFALFSIYQRIFWELPLVDIVP